MTIENSSEVVLAYTDQAYVAGHDPYLMEYAGGVATSSVSGLTTMAISQDGNYAFAASNAGLVTIFVAFDISNPASPTYLSKIDDGTNLGRVYRIKVVGNYAYVPVTNKDRLLVIDVSNPASMSITGNLYDATNLNGAWGIDVSGNYAYVSAYDGDRLTVVDISNPASPSVTGSYYSATYVNEPQEVVKAGNHCWVGTRTAYRLTSVDVSNPASPSLGGSYYSVTNLPNTIAMEIAAGYAYCLQNNAAVASLTVMNVSNPASPTYVRRLTSLGTSSYGLVGTSNQMARSGSFIYLLSENGTGIAQLDISTPGDPKFVLSLNLENDSGDSVDGIAVSGDYAWIACYSGTPDILSVKVNRTPLDHVHAVLEDATNLDGAYAIDADGTYAYIAAYDGGRLTIVDISNPASPSVVGSVTHANLVSASGVAVAGNSCYVATNATSGKLVVVNVSNKASPSVSGTCTFSGSYTAGFDVAVSGTTAFVSNPATSGNSIYVIDVSNPAAPSQTARYQDATYLAGVRGIDLVGTTLYCACESASRLTILDVTNPASISRLGSVQNSTTIRAAYDVDVDGAYAYLACYGYIAPHGHTMAVVDVSNPASPSIIGSGHNACEMAQCRFVRKSSNYAVVSGGYHGVVVWDVSTPSAPTFQGSVIDTSAFRGARGLHVSGSYVYVCGSVSDTLAVLDMTQVYSPPATGSSPPTVQGLRFVRESLSPEKMLRLSATHQADRQRRYSLETGRRAAGEVEVELSATEYKDWLEAALGAVAVSVNVTTAADVTITASAGTIVSGATDFDAAGVVAGMWIRMAGSSASGNNRAWYVTSVATKTITVNTANASLTDTTADDITVTGWMIRSGSTLADFWIEKHFPGVAQYERFTGMQGAGVRFRIAANEIVRAVFAWLGDDATLESSSYGSSTVGYPSDVPIRADQVLHVEEGSAWDGAENLIAGVREVTVSIDNSLRDGAKVGVKTPASIDPGWCEVTGTMLLYFGDTGTTGTVDRLLAHAATNVRVTLVDAAGTWFVLSLPNVRIEGDMPVAREGPGEVLLPVRFRALRDDALGCTVQIDVV